MSPRTRRAERRWHIDVRRRTWAAHRCCPAGRPTSVAGTSTSLGGCALRASGADTGCSAPRCQTTPRFRRWAGRPGSLRRDGHVGAARLLAEYRWRDRGPYGL